MNINNLFIKEFLKVYYKTGSRDKLNNYLVKASLESLTIQLKNGGILPFFYNAVLSGRVPLKLPSHIIEKWKFNTNEQGIANAMLACSSNDIIKKLNKISKEYIVLKGFPVIDKLYTNRWERFTSDLDIFIRKEDFSIIKNFLFDQGFIYNNPDLSEFLAENKSEVHFIKRIGIYPFNVDIQWNINNFTKNSPLDYLFSNEQINFFDSFEMINLDGEMVNVPTMETQFIFSVFHFILHHSFIGLKWFVDLCQFLYKYGNSLDWNLIKKTVKNPDYKKIMGICLAIICEITGRSVIPDEAYEELTSIKYNPIELLYFKNILLSKNSLIHDYTCKLLLPVKLTDKVKVLFYFLFDNSAILKWNIPNGKTLFSRLQPLYILYRICKEAFSTKVKKDFTDL